MGTPYVNCASFSLKPWGLAMYLDQMQVKISLNTLVAFTSVPSHFTAVILRQLLRRIKRYNHHGPNEQHAKSVSYRPIVNVMIGWIGNVRSLVLA